MKRLVYELVLTPVPRVLMILALALSAVANPYVIYASGFSGPFAARAIDVAMFVFGVLAGAQLLAPELRASTVELSGSRACGLAGVVRYRSGLVALALAAASLWMSGVLVWADAYPSFPAMALAFFASGVAGFGLALAAFAISGSPTVSMALSAIFMGAFLVAAVVDVKLGVLQVFALYGFYGVGPLILAKLAWVLFALFTVAFSLGRVQHPSHLTHEE